MLSGVQSATASLWSQLQQQQAQRNADQAEAKARALQTQAQSAQSEADRAQENARNLQVRSDQAQGEADAARRGVQAREGIAEVQQGFEGLRTQLRNIQESPSTTTPPESAPPPVAVGGQTLGTQVDILV